MPDQPRVTVTPNVPTIKNVPTIGQGNGPQQGKPSPVDPKLLFNKKQAMFRRIYYQTIRPGALLSFQYLYYKHDPNPLVLCGGTWLDGKVVGINLHYLTFRYIKYLTNQYCGRNFSYHYIKGDTFVKNSFRSYKRDGLKNIQLLDCDFLNSVLGKVRSFNPKEIEAMRQYIKQQLQQKLGQTAKQLKDNSTAEFEQIISNQQQGNKDTRADARKNPVL
jgi:hypothetical protein